MSKKYWSKRKRYGWGWTPVTWQGWTMVFVWLIIVLGSSFILSGSAKNEMSPEGWVYLSIVFLSTIPLILLSYKTGPKPRWRWGKKDDDNPDEDF